MNLLSLSDLQLILHGSCTQHAEIVLDVQERPLDCLFMITSSFLYFVPLLHRLFGLLQFLSPDRQLLLRDVLAANQQQSITLLASFLRELRDASQHSRTFLLHLVHFLGRTHLTTHRTTIAPVSQFYLINTSESHEREMTLLSAPLQ